jgi:hypothetical protein
LFIARSELADDLATGWNALLDGARNTREKSGEPTGLLHGLAWT